jgi:hypothetical protein
MAMGQRSIVFLWQRQTSKRGNGDGGDRSLAIAMATAIQAGATGATSMALGHWSNCNGNGARATTIDGISIVLLSQRKTSTIVVVENVQNVWLTNTPDVLRFD